MMPRVVIVGAGAAGLSAGTELLRLQPKLSLTILEAAERVGGRVCSVEMGALSYESGAQWLHGETENTAFDMAMKAGICDPPDFLGINDLLPILCDDEGNALSDDMAEHFMDVFEQGETTMHNLSNVARGQSLAQHLKPFYERKLQCSEQVKQALIDLLHRMACCTEASENWHEVSFRSAVTDFHTHPNDNFYVTFKKEHKFNDLIHLMHEPIKSHVRLGAAVREIEALPWDVANEAERTCSMKVTLESGEVLMADLVLVTVSLGFLKANAKKMFTPSLSQSKQLAIDQLGFGVVDKIFLLFDHSFWPDDKESFLFLHYSKPVKFEEMEQDDTLHWTRGIFCAERIQHRPQALCVWVHGPFARRMEKLGDQQVLDDLNVFLTKMLKNVVKEVPRPIDYYISRWGSNPYVLGSWSFGSVSSDELGIVTTDLAKAEFEGRLRFAGEATAGPNFSTVPGAIDSGRREARAMIEHLSTM